MVATKAHSVENTFQLSWMQNNDFYCKTFSAKSHNLKSMWLTKLSWAKKCCATGDSIKKSNSFDMNNLWQIHNYSLSNKFENERELIK